MEIFRLDYLRSPTITDIEKIHAHHEEKHKFLGMLGSLDCIDWKWFGCPIAYKRNIVDVLMAQIIHFAGGYFVKTYGYDILSLVLLGDINVIHQSLLLNGLKQAKAPEIPFVANAKRLRYKRMHEGVRRDVERAFDALKKKLAILANLA
nr:hypothetical protein [Tanacetum cinerariifolium]